MAVLQCNDRRTVNKTKLFENLLYVQMIVETDSRRNLLHIKMTQIF